jgi:hypothetical protein
MLKSILTKMTLTTLTKKCSNGYLDSPRHHIVHGYRTLAI